MTSGRVGRAAHVTRASYRSAGPHTRRRAGEGTTPFLPRVPRSTDFSARFTVSVTLCPQTMSMYIAAWVARLSKVVLKFTPPRGNARSPSSLLRFLPALPPSLCTLLRLLMIALDRARDLTRCEYNARVYARIFAEVLFYRDT